MIPISNNYKNYLETSLAISPKNKIVVDGVEYLGDVIKSYPKISHQNSSIYGGFPAKTLSFEIYNFDNDIDFENKEIYCYKGLDINGTTEYLLQGIFIPKDTNIKTNITTRSISISKAQDRTQLLDGVYQSDLDWETSHTGLEIVQEVCIKTGVTLATTSFNFATYVFTHQPNFNESTTYRQAISRIAEIGGEIAFINYSGNLVIKASTSTGDTFQRTRYENLSHEKPITYNTIVLGKEGIDDDIIYPENIVGDRVEYKILDNPYADPVRSEIISVVANYIIGKTIVPFNAQNVVDGFYLELNDSISIVDKDNNTIEATILDYSTSNRIKANLKTETEITTSDYNLAGSSKEGLNAVKLEVDHINGEIRALATSVESAENDLGSITNEYSSAITASANGIRSEVAATYTTKTETETSIQNAKTEIEQTANDYTLNFYNENIKPTTDGLAEEIAGEIEERKAVIRMTAENNLPVIELGATDSPVSTKYKNDGMYIEENGSTTSYFKNGKSYNHDMEVLNSLTIGNFAFKPRANGNLSIVFIGGGNNGN